MFVAFQPNSYLDQPTLATQQRPTAAFRCREARAGKFAGLRLDKTTGRIAQVARRDKPVLPSAYFA